MFVKAAWELIHHLALLHLISSFHFEAFLFYLFFFDRGSGKFLKIQILKFWFGESLDYKGSVNSGLALISLIFMFLCRHQDLLGFDITFKVFSVSVNTAWVTIKTIKTDQSFNDSFTCPSHQYIPQVSVTVFNIKKPANIITDNSLLYSVFVFLLTHLPVINERLWKF